MKYSERRSVWHSIRNEFCFEYAHLSLNLTRKLQLAHYSQCGRCGRIVCQLDGCETLPPLNKEEAEKRKEERKRKAKEKFNIIKKQKASNNLADPFLIGAKQLLLSPKKIFSLNAGDDQSKAASMLSKAETKKLISLASKRKKKQAMVQNASKVTDNIENIKQYLELQHYNFHRPSKPAEDSTFSVHREKPGRRTFVYTPVIPFLTKKPALMDHNVTPASKFISHHEQAIRLVKHGKKYGRKCRSMLQDTYPNYNISEQGKYIQN